MARNKLELTWVGKDVRPRLEPRVLIEDPALSHRAVPGVGGDVSLYDNRLIFGDNLLAFDSDPERMFAVILEGDASVRNWLRPPPGIPRIEYDGRLYEPDFIAETESTRAASTAAARSEMS